MSTRACFAYKHPQTTVATKISEVPLQARLTLKKEKADAATSLSSPAQEATRSGSRESNISGFIVLKINDRFNDAYQVP